MAGDLTEARTRHIDELRSAMETRAILERRNSWWTNVRHARLELVTELTMTGGLRCSCLAGYSCAQTV